MSLPPFLGGRTPIKYHRAEIIHVITRKPVVTVLSHAFYFSAEMVREQARQVMRERGIASFTHTIRMSTFWE